MVYYINYYHWITVCSFLVCFLFLLNIKSKRILTVFFCLNAFIMFLPRMVPMTDIVVVDYELSEDRDIKDGKMMDNMVSFKDINYYLNDSLGNFCDESDIAPGFYNAVKVIQTRQLINQSGLEVYVHVETTLRDIWVQEKEESVDNNE